MAELEITLAVSTYERGKVLFIFSNDGTNVRTKSVSANRPLGLALDENLDLIMAEKTGISRVKWKLQSPFVIEHWNTENLDIHDIFWCQGSVLAVNTKFNCLTRIDQHKSQEVWRPFFINQKNQFFDTCHLNGMAIKENQPFALTALSDSIMPQGWRQNIIEGGILLDAIENKILLGGLGMPHSPRYKNEKIYFLQSAFGLLSIFDLRNKQLQNIAIGGMLRGLSFYGDYIFLARSQIRKNSSTFSKLPVAHRHFKAGVVVLHRPSKQIVSECIFSDEIEEIFDILPIPKV